MVELRFVRRYVPFGDPNDHTARSVMVLQQSDGDGGWVDVPCVDEETGQQILPFWPS